MTDLTPAREQEIRDRQEWSEDYDVIAELLAALDAERARNRQNARKVEAYDAARATVKQEGNTRAYYVLRAEAAEDRNRNLEAVAEAARKLDDGPELRHWLGSQDVIGSKVSCQIAEVIHALLAVRAALAVLEEPQ